MKIKNKKSRESGFTLIEIMVSISIFSIVMVIVIGALLMLNDANKKAQALRAVVDNLNFAIEDMTRNIKTGGEYACGVTIDSNGEINSNSATQSACSSTNLGIVIRGGLIGGATRQRQCIAYLFVSPTAGDPSGHIMYATGRAADSPGVSICSNINNWTSPTDLISPEVIINDASFKVVNTDPSPTASYQQQPIVIININGEIDTIQYKFKTPFSIQTTVSQRSSLE